MNDPVKTTFQIALRALHTNRGRTFLTVLGIVIGIGAVIAVMSVGQGLQSFIVDQVATFGTNLIEIEIKAPNTGRASVENAASLIQGVEVTTLTLDDENAVSKLSNVGETYAAALSQQLVSHQNENKQIILFGASSSFIEVDSSEVAEGRFFTDEEDKSLANVAVIGANVKKDIFGDNDFLDEQIRIGKQKFRVIGVMQDRGATFGFDMDNMIYVPVRTLQKKIMGINHVSAIFAQANNPELIDQTAAEITDLMRERHGTSNEDEDDFSVFAMTEAVEILDTVFLAITLLLIVVAGISLVVGGIGITNIMYVSVLERTYEIGLRKAVGASSQNILLQFLMEAIIITLLGAGLGIMFGIGLSWAIALGAASVGFGWPFVVSVPSLILASGVAMAIGLVFGVFPARTAAKMDPAEAIRHG